MTRALFAAGVAALALSGTASADGCAEDYLTQPDAAPRYVEIDDQGAVTVHPARVVGSATRLVSQTQTFADCVV